MHLSVILSTYNSPLWLEKVLWGYSVQSHQDFELLIADDGSGEETARLIESMRQKTNLTLRHVWHPDEGFRKCRILNKALLHASHDYVVFSDGDCIPRCDFLSVHAAEAAPGCYLSGGYHKLPITTSEAIATRDILSGDCFHLNWLKAHGLPSSYKNSKLTASPRQARWLNRLTPTACNFKGSNASAWMDDIKAVNGFDEGLAYGGEDREFGVRLTNIGISPRHVRYNAIVIHLDHKRGYVDPEVLKSNKAYRKWVKDSGCKVTPRGFNLHRDSEGDRT